MYEQILSALGHSIFYEECKGNFAQARRLAEQWVDTSTRSGDPNVLADALVSRGVIDLLQGEALAAYASFEQVERLVPDDTNRRLCALSYTLLATYEQYNTFPDRNGVGASEVTVRWQGAEDLAPLDKRWQSLLQQANDPAMRFWSWLAYGFLCNLQPARYTLESSRYTPPNLSREQLLQTFLDAPGRLRAMAEASGLPALAAFADLAAADLYRRAGDLNSARQHLDRARAGYQQANDMAGVAVCVMTHADWQCAPFSTPLAWNFALLDSSSEGSNLAISLEADEFSTGTAASYAEAERLFQEAGALRGLAAVQLRHGYLAMLKDDYAVAARCALAASDGYAACEDWRGYWVAQTHLLMCRLAGAWQPDLDEFTLARQIGAWGKDKGSFSFTLGLGILLNRFARHWLIRRGSYEHALACSRAAQELFEALGATTNATQCLVDQGMTYQAAGERITALTFYEQALDRYTQGIDTHPRIAVNLRQRVIMLTTTVYQLYLQQIDTDGMERSAERLREQVTHLPGSGDLSTLLGTLAQDLSTVFSDQSLPSAGEKLPEGIEFWSLYQMAQSLVEQAAILVPLYRFRQAKSTGDAARAEAYLNEVAAALQTVLGAQRDYLEAVVLSEQKEYARAAQAFHRHLEAGGANTGFVGSLTEAMKEFGGEHGQAEARLQQRRTHEQAFSFMVMIKAYAEARIHLHVLEQLDGPKWWASNAKPWQPLCDAAEMYEGLNELPAALSSYDQAIAQLEARRSQLSRDELKTALASDKSSQYLYFLAARAAIKSGDAARGFDYAERGKARALLDLMSGTRLMASHSESEALRKWRQLQAQLTLRRGLLAQARAQRPPDAERIAFFIQQITDDETRLRAIENELARAIPNFHQAVNPPAKTMPLAEVRTALPPKTVLLEYFFLGESMLAWAITRNEERTHQASVEASTVARQVRAFHEACEKNATVEPAARLTELFLEPFADLIRASDHIIFVPHGAAHILPFQALPFDGQPLAVTRATSYLPSASALQFLKAGAPAEPPNRILAVGDPTKNLSAAAIEAAYVASLFGQSALIGDDATEQTVRERIADSPLLHFATHGNLSEDAPLNSSISLANGEKLTVYELMGMRLQAELVVLSACNTGQGQTTGGDDVLGLTRGLLAAGARAAIVSLWPVNDVSTSLFMSEFYRHFRKGVAPYIALNRAQNYLRGLAPDRIKEELERLHAELSKAGAHGLKLDGVSGARAQRHLVPSNKAPGRHDYRHPYYWAPFVLVG